MSEALMLQKVITCEVKEVAPRVLEFTGSTEDLDRQKDSIKAKGWKLDNYLKNPVFMWVHDYTQPPIGKTKDVFVKGKKLMFHVEFADKETYEFADTIYRLYKGGFLKAVSVAFSPLDWEGKSGEDDMPAWGGNVFTEQELLELSGCPVPVNPDALATAKQKRVINAKEYKQLKGLWQDIANAPIVDLTGDEPVIINPVTKPEVTEDYIRIPVKAEAGKHEGHRIRTITISEKEAIKALYCGECKVVITYLFDKDEWELADAEAWVEEHSKSAREFSQPSMADEIDYLFTMIDSSGLSPENGKLLGTYLDKHNLRLTGSDIPETIELEVKEIETLPPPPAEALTEQDKEKMAQIISQTIDRVVKTKLGDK